uniref:Protein kinase domain-containing protein n=1 Tax=Steinernema glaseri TaxID=37863 RepID=A0A1I7YNB5_9BILA
MSDEENLEEELGIRPGAVVDSAKAKFVIVKLLGEGGFGAVFKVHDIKDKNQEYAMKVEKKLENRRHSKLKMEIAILKLVSSERAEKSHFTSIIDRGKKEKYFFLVMQLVGKSLADLKMQRPDKVFSLGTGIGASMQCLEAVEDLHKHGFIHRDLKPANFASGLGAQKRTVYILDFGIARRILNDKDELKTPRASVCFKGTVRFASMACHRNHELGPKDDCESWFYLMLDLIIATGLPWKKIQDRNEVLRVKEECRKDKRDQFFHGVKCKESLGKIMEYIDALHYHDRIDYSYVYDLLKEAATSCGARLDDPYDWEEDTNTKSRKRA